MRKIFKSLKIDIKSLLINFSQDFCFHIPLFNNQLPFKQINGANKTLVATGDNVICFIQAFISPVPQLYVVPKMFTRLLLFLAIGSCLSSCARYEAISFRPDHWADPVAIEGVPNLCKIDDNLYRSGQPTAEGMKNLEQFGVRTVINLRAFSDDADEIEGTNLRQVNIPMHAWLPRDRTAKHFVSLTSNAEKGPFLVHCYHGSDRTGSMIALYRASHSGWTSDEAVREMLYGGFGFHKIWQPLICWTKNQAQSGRREVLTPAPHTTGHTDP